MKKLQIAMLVLAALAAVVYWGSRVPAEPTMVIHGVVVSTEDLDARGLRAIKVRFDNGEERVIETLVPFFVKPGYDVRVGIFRSPLFGAKFDLLPGTAANAEN